MDKTAKRFVSRLTQDTLALVLAGGRGSRLGVLTEWRTKPAVPFGGKHRIIDFTLSNCLNSGIRRICVLTQYKSHSLIQHLTQGWSGLSAERGEFIDIIPAQQWLDDETWYEGTANAVFQCLDIIDAYRPRHVLILPGDHIYAMDYGETLAGHVESGADFTIGCTRVSMDTARQLGVMQVDAAGRIVEFFEKPEAPKPIPDDPSHALASMGIYVLSYEYLRERLHEDAVNAESSHDFGKDLIPAAVARGDNLRSFLFRSSAIGDDGYWRDVGTIDSYYEANLEVLSPEPPIDLYDPGWPFRTFQPQLPAARFVGDESPCLVKDVMVSGGCIITKSNLDQSLLYSNVRVGEGSDLQGVLALPDCQIGTGCRLKRVILDNGCLVPDGTVVGKDSQIDRQRFHVSDDGIVVINRAMLGQGSTYKPTFANPR